MNSIEYENLKSEKPNIEKHLSRTRNQHILVYSKSNKNMNSGNDKLGIMTSTNYSSKKEISD